MDSFVPAMVVFFEHNLELMIERNEISREQMDRLRAELAKSQAATTPPDMQESR